MQETLIHPPRTIMEVFKMLPEGTSAEVIDNTLYMSPTPVTNHQRIIRKLTVQIDQYLEASNLGELFLLRLICFWMRLRMPYNRIFWLFFKNNEDIIDEESTIHGVPDLN